MVDLAEPTWPEFQGAVRGFVTEAPAALGEPFEVVVPKFSTEHGYEIRRWTARGLTKPAVGDEVLVVEDDSGLPWVPAWWPAAGDVVHPHDFGIVTALPTKEPTPAAGDLCRFKVATGVYWDLLYTAEATYPWAKIGGPALRLVATSNPTSTIATYVEMTGGSITVPLLGEYKVELGAADVTGSVANTGRIAVFSGAGELSSIASYSSGGGWGQSVYFPLEPAILANGAVLTGRYKNEAATGSVTFYAQYIAIDPKRVG